MPIVIAGLAGAGIGYFVSGGTRSIERITLYALAGGALYVGAKAFKVI